MCAVFVHLTNDVKQKGVDIIIQRLVIKKQLGQQTQVLTIHLGLSPVHLKDTDRLVSVNLSSRWMTVRTLGLVSVVVPTQPHILETVLTDVQRLDIVFGGEGTEIPSLHFPPTHNDARNVLDLGNLLVLLF